MEAQLRREVAREFNVAMRDVIVTGSAKLGFTLTTKPGRPTFSPFCDTSDIDVAIISTSLFVEVWKEVSNYFKTQGNWESVGAFRRFLMEGWIRPDKLPISDEFPRSDGWFEFFRNLTNEGKYGPYKLAAGVYFDEAFWENYASSALRDARQSLEVLT